MVIGVYKITNKINGKFYIGSSNDIKCRWNEHIRDFKNKQHRNKHFQRAWYKYGEENFKFEILEETTEEEKIDREQYYLDTLQPWNREIGYNISRKATGGCGNGEDNHFYGKKHTDESRLKISKNHADVSGENSSAAKLTNNDVINIKIRFCRNDDIKDIYKIYEDKITLFHLYKIRRVALWSETGKEYNEQLKYMYENKLFTKTKSQYNARKESTLIIEKLYKQNYNSTEIFEMTGYKKSIINNVIKRYKQRNNLPVNKPLQKEVREERNKKIIEMYLEGHSNSYIQKSLSLTKSVVEKVINNYKNK